MSIQYRLAKAYLEKLYNQGLISFDDMEALGQDMKKTFDKPGTEQNKIA